MLVLASSSLFANKFSSPSLHAKVQMKNICKLLMGNELYFALRALWYEEDNTRSESDLTPSLLGCFTK